MIFTTSPVQSDGRIAGGEQNIRGDTADRHLGMDLSQIDGDPVRTIGHDQVETVTGINQQALIVRHDTIITAQHQDVITRAAIQLIGSNTANENIVAGPAIQRVVANASGDPVITGSAGQQVITPATIEHGAEVAAASREGVVARVALYGFQAER